MGILIAFYNAFVKVSRIIVVLRIDKRHANTIRPNEGTTSIYLLCKEQQLGELILFELVQCFSDD